MDGARGDPHVQALGSWPPKAPALPLLGEHRPGQSEAVSTKSLGHLGSFGGSLPLWCHTSKPALARHLHLGLWPPEQGLPPASVRAWGAKPVLSLALHSQRM